MPSLIHSKAQRFVQNHSFITPGFLTHRMTYFFSISKLLCQNTNEKCIGAPMLFLDRPDRPTGHLTEKPEVAICGIPPKKGQQSGLGEGDALPPPHNYINRSSTTVKHSSQIESNSNNTSNHGIQSTYLGVKTIKQMLLNTSYLQFTISLKQILTTNCAC